MSDPGNAVPPRVSDVFDLSALSRPELDREIVRLSRLLLKGKEAGHA